MIPAWQQRTTALLLAGAVLYPSAGFAQISAPQQPAARAPATEPQAKAAAPKPEKAEPTKRKATAKADAGTAPKLDAAAAQGEVEAGINALGLGRNDNAVASLSTALAAGSLPSAQTARALYYRGVAYRRQAKPAQAISDLTSALWIKAGLSDDQRADALQQRSGAYREAGLPDQAEPPAARTASPAPSKSSNSAFASVAPPAPGGSSNSVGEFFSNLFGGSSSSPPAAQPAVQARPVQPQPVQPQPVVAVTSAPTAAPAARAPPPPRVATVGSLPLGFQEFPGQFEDAPVRSPNRANVQSPASASETAVSQSWSAATQVKTTAAPAQRVAQTAARAPSDTSSPVVTGSVAPVAAAPARAAAPAVSAESKATPSPKTRTAAAPAPSGNLQVQVAAVRTAVEARTVASKLQAQFARELAGRAPVVDETTVGSLGTIFRVQVGPFASVQDTNTLCSKLRSEGMDCRVVSQ